MLFFLILIGLISTGFVCALVVYAFKFPKRRTYFFACAWAIGLGGIGIIVLINDYAKNQNEHIPGSKQKIQISEK